jgi:hypothetical protein
MSGSSGHKQVLRMTPMIPTVPFHSYGSWIISSSSTVHYPTPLRVLSFFIHFAISITSFTQSSCVTLFVISFDHLGSAVRLFNMVVTRFPSSLCRCVYKSSKKNIMHAKNFLATTHNFDQICTFSMCTKWVEIHAIIFLALMIKGFYQRPCKLKCPLHFGTKEVLQIMIKIHSSTNIT